MKWNYILFCLPLSCLADSKKFAKDKKDVEKSPETVGLKEGENEVTEKKKKKSKQRKEKSVLQTKLTKLAIQIGYVGKNIGYPSLYFTALI